MLFEQAICNCYLVDHLHGGDLFLAARAVDSPFALSHRVSARAFQLFTCIDLVSSSAWKFGYVFGVTSGPPTRPG
jgi:hypothetical protein